MIERETKVLELMKSEIWDCYDRDFNLVEGKVLARGQEDAFSEDEYHLVSEIAVKHRDGTYLLMQRDFNKKGRPGMWEFTAGGAALMGESPLECAKRELFEETGLVADTIYEVGRMAAARTHCHFVEFVAVVSCDKASVTLQEGETIAYRWVEKSELLQRNPDLATHRIFEILPDIDLGFDVTKDTGTAQDSVAGFDIDVTSGTEPTSDSPVQWLFFDVGSTLMDEEKAYLHRLQDVADMTGEPFDKIYDMAIGFYKENRKGDLEVMTAFGLPKLKWYKEDEKLYPETVDCLETLSKKYKLGVIANQSLGTADRLEQHGILKYIDLVVASAEEGVAKPDRRIFEIALERAGCRTENAVMIGDRIDNDIVPAKKMGMRTVWIKQGFGKYWQVSGEEEQADYVVENLDELTAIFA